VLFTRLRQQGHDVHCAGSMGLDKMAPSQTASFN
jgi:hypothetical protein